MTMQQMITRSVSLLSMFLFAASTLPHAYCQVVVQDTNVQLSGGPVFGSGVPESSQILTVSQTVGLGDSTTVSFDVSVIPPPPVFPNPPALVSLVGTNVALDEGADLYLAEVGDLFSLNTIQAGNFQPLVEGTTFSSSTFELGDFFLAFATNDTSSGFPPVGASRDVFGWAHFSVEFDGDITLLDNAVAYGTGNIIVGQNAAVPEPSSAALIGLVVASFLGRRRR